MALFNAPAWMMKGGGGSPATISNMSDADPYNMGKTPVKCKIKNAKLTIANGGTVFYVSFDIERNGFVEDPRNVELWIETPIGGHWRYIIPNISFNFTGGGSRRKEISNSINRNASSKQALMNAKKICFLFFNSSEIISDQVDASIDK